MLIAKGLAGGKKFAVIDTENGRASMYADQFQFDVLDLKAPFRPQNYIDALAAAKDYPVIVVDSASHEYAGDGGLLDWHDELLDTFVARAKKAGDSRADWQIEDANTMRAWIEPKTEHKQLVTALLSMPAHVIFCFRAEPKIEIAKEGGKTVIRPKETMTGLHGWVPITEKNLPFEMTASFLLMADRPGVPMPIKLQQQHKPFFQLDKPITEECGRLIGAWADGGSVGKLGQPVPQPEQPAPAPKPNKHAKPQTPAAPPNKSEAESTPQKGQPTGAAGLSAVEWAKRIEGAQTMGELGDMRKELIGVTFQNGDRQLLIDVFVAKKKQLEKPPEQKDAPWI
jgi:hypothetical protein